jgi:hypothetical protein
MKDFFQKNWQHFAVIAVFIIISVVYFAPEFSGYDLRQHDVEQFKGMSQETQMFREKTGEEPLWTNSMFGGMPTIQISTLYSGNIFQTTIIGFLRFFGVPSGIFLLHLLGFYVLALCLRVRPWIGFIGAVAFALATYEIVILQAGHNSKATTVALMAPVIGTFIMAYRHNWKWGALLSGIFMSFQLASNHLQVTYYMGFLLAGLGIYELVRAVKAKEIKQFAIATGALIGVYLLALVINYGNISLTNDYAKQTIRGGNDVTIQSDGTESKINTSGLDKEYITNWSYGVGESFTLLSPYVKGSASAMLADTRFAEMVENSDRSGEDIRKVMEAPFPVYWGDQPMTSGPVYIGIVMVFLLVLGMIYIKDGSKWVYLGVAVLALALSWGKNFMGLTDFFIDNIPGYNKFRTVTIIMVLIELCVPVIAVLLLEKLYRERAAIAETKKKFLITSAAFIVFLIAVKVVGLGDNFSTKQEIERVNTMPDAIRGQISGIDPQVMAQQYGVDVRDPQQMDQFINAQVESANEGFELMKTVRQDIFHSSMNRSILFAFLAVGLLALYFYTQMSTALIFAGLGLLVLVDLIPVDQNYLSNETLDNGDYKHWMPEDEARYPMTATAADVQILENEMMNPSIKKAVDQGEREGRQKADDLAYSGNSKRRVVDAYRFSALNFATNYRVFDYNNPWGSSRTSYFHKALGGYHGAKLRNIQNLFEFHLAQSNNKVFDMMNVKYFIQGEAARPNSNALGNAWLVKKVKVKETPNDEILALGAEFMVENSGDGVLLVNGLPSKGEKVFGGEKLQYLLAGRDTLPVQLPNGLTKGTNAVMVMDANGQTNLVPEFTLAADTAKSFTKLVQMAIVEDFNPSEEAVMLKSEASKLSTTNYSGKGTVRLLSYAPNKLKYSAETEGKQLAVFSEVYYADGWKAYVDGKEQSILKVNYLLRGLELASGKHTIEFKFELPKYTKSNNYALIGSFVLILLIAGFGFQEFKKRKD